jgi:hypothetical protein
MVTGMGSAVMEGRGVAEFGMTCRTFSFENVSDGEELQDVVLINRSH